MHSNFDTEEFALSGAPKSPLPKLTRADRALVKRKLESAPSDYDPITGLRLALAAKLPVRPEWSTEPSIDMALNTGDIAKRLIDLAESRLVLRAPAALNVLERRSRISPVPVFRALCNMVLPKKGKKAAKCLIVWDEETAIRIGYTLIQSLPGVFKGKPAKAMRPVEQALRITRETVLQHPSPEAAQIAVEILATLEHEAGWQSLEDTSEGAIVDAILEMPAEVAERLLENADFDKLHNLVHATTLMKEADRRLRAFISGLNPPNLEALPLGSRRWIATYLGSSDESEPETLASRKMSDASLERLALILITAWDARQDGEKAMYAFSLLREILGSAFGLVIVGEVGQPVTFDPALYESRGPRMLGEPAKLVRPRIEYRMGSDLQVMIKGMVEPISG